jgi:nucleoside-diphosphate-sugar epimerase
MRVALTGATGLVGQFVARRLLAAGHGLVALGRPSPWGGAARPWRLGEPAPLDGCDALVHCAFAHVPGRYRGGEGDDPQGFLLLNLEGTLRLWDEAAGRRTVFLSSRAVYDGLPPGTALTEDFPVAPPSLYGRVKSEAERALHARGGGASLRATGVFGPPAPGQRHKWADLFAAFAAGEAMAPAVGTEVHGDDVAGAVLLLLERGDTGPFNCSDFVLDRRDLLLAWSEVSGARGTLPPRSGAGPGVMDTSRLRALGWTPLGAAGLWEALGALVEARPDGPPPGPPLNHTRRGASGEGDRTKGLRSR